MYSFLLAIFLTSSLLAQEFYSTACINSSGNGFKLLVTEENGVIVIKSTPLDKELGSMEPTIISNTDGTVITAPLVQMSESGIATAVWQSCDSNNNTYMETAIYSQSEGWQHSKIISDPSENLNPGDYTLQINEKGYSSVSWRSLTPDRLSLRNSLSYLGSWSAPQTLSIEENVRWRTKN